MVPVFIANKDLDI